MSEKKTTLENENTPSCLGAVELILVPRKLFTSGKNTLS
jgi:hypothetical protein